MKSYSKVEFKAHPTVNGDPIVTRRALRLIYLAMICLFLASLCSLAIAILTLTG